MTLARLRTEDVCLAGGSPALDAAELEGADPESILALALEEWPGRVALVTSFQAEGLVLLDMAWRIDPAVRVITLDTGRLPQETYEVIDRARRRYGVEVEIFFPDACAVEALVRKGGPNLFYHSARSRLDCCHVRKVEPLKRALTGLEAWITGLRRSQGAARAAVCEVEIDREHGDIVKLNPLAGWSREQVDAYALEHDVPRHPLYAQGYASIGCAPCTRPVAPGEDPRAGRWWWEDGGDKECGLHVLRGPGAARVAGRRRRS